MDIDGVRRKVARLREKTVANGASVGEAENAARKADALEAQYGLGGRPPPGPGGAYRRPRGSPRAALVVVTLDQHRALRRGETVDLLRRSEPQRYRLDGPDLVRWTAAAGETRHAIVAVQTSCRNVLIRYA